MHAFRKLIKEIISEVATSADTLYPRTTDHEHKHLDDPALMTFEEYYKLINPTDDWHEDYAYNHSLDDNHYSYINLKSGEWKLVNTKKIGKIEIQFFHKNEKLVYGSMENDEWIQTPEEEFHKKGKTMAGHQFVAYHPQEDIIVGSAQDEWGCVLVSVVKEYQQLGIGEELVKLYRHYFPYKTSGGFTSAGLKQFKKYYHEKVSTYLRNGIYSDMVRKGQISLEKVNQILKSAGNLPKFQSQQAEPKNKLAQIYGGNGEYMFYISENSVVIFDTALKELRNTNEIDDLNDRFINKLVKCYIYYNSFGMNKEYYNIYAAHASDEKFMRTGLDMLLCTGVKLSNFYIDKNFNTQTKTMLNNIFADSEAYKLNFIKKDNIILISEKRKMFNFNHLVSISKNWFKKNDKYEEFENFVIELADVIARPE